MVRDEIRPGYKFSEVGNVPECWEVVDVDHSSFLKGRIGWQGLTTKEYLSFGNYLLVTGTEFRDGGIDWGKCHYVSKERFDQDPNIKLRVGDILVTKDGTIGKIAFINSLPLPATLNSGVFVLRPINDSYYPKYFYYILQSNYFKKFIDILKAGSTISHLYQYSFKNFLFPLPPYSEQQKIARILSNTESLIESLDKLITKKKHMKWGLMQTLLTRGIGHTKFKKTEIGEIPDEWSITKASDIYDIVTGTTPSTMVKEYWEQGTIEWFTPKDLRYVGSSFSIFQSERKITEKAMIENSLTLLPSNSILLSTRAPVGYVGINIKEATFNQGCKGLVPKQPEKVDTRFHAFFISRKSNFLNTLSGGSTFKELSKDTLGNITLPLPESEEQQKIAKILSETDKEIESLEQKRDKYKLLKTGMMQQLLTGGIRVK